MNGREVNKLLENNWLPNGSGTIMVSLSTVVRIIHTSPQIHTSKRQDGGLSGGRIPPFFLSVCHPVAPARAGTQRGKVLILSGSAGIVKIRPRYG
jgi:hypothetical protein